MVDMHGQEYFPGRWPGEQSDMQDVKGTEATLFTIIIPQAEKEVVLSCE